MELVHTAEAEGERRRVVSRRSFEGGARADRVEA